MTGKPETLLSAIHQSIQLLPSSAQHPFSTSSEEASKHLQDIMDNATAIATSLFEHRNLDFSNAKLVSLLRQETQLRHTLHVTAHSTKTIGEALRRKPSLRYGEDIPLDRSTLVDWCIARLEAWVKSVKMEAFADPKPEGLTMIIGGQVLVIDADLAIDRSDASKPTVKVSGTKTSYAIPNEGAPSTGGGPVSLDAFLGMDLQKFIDEVHKPDDERDPVRAAKLADICIEHLAYLSLLDKLAARPPPAGGLRWFNEFDSLCHSLQAFAKREAEAAASALAVDRPPLDIFLLRGHALPLPYLTAPSVSFLAHISPRAYLTMLRDTAATTPDHDSWPQFDIPLMQVRHYVSKGGAEGMTTAILRLVQCPYPPLVPADVVPFTERPTFALGPGKAESEYAFPKVETPQADDPMGDPSAMEVQEERYQWVLDFTDGGRSDGVVMSQIRMRDIELIINPLSGMDASLDTVPIVAFGTGSWVDLLLKPQAGVSPERYTTLYQSPTSAHPPLQLRLTSPEEPGYFLQKVPVRTMKEIWGILEIVREQCWLNEMLTVCQWQPEGIESKPSGEVAPASLPMEDEEVTEDDLTALLTGTLTPRKLPVNVALPTDAPDDAALFGDDLDIAKPRRPRIVMTCPERPPMSGLVEIVVRYDETRSRGVAVEVNGAMGANLTDAVLEEVCRRGGALGLAGRIWISA
ncbi:hypothetical protein BD626DRAFT_475209 [Schizophyllum amplum]|uniref:Mediator complex subunit 1 n=1 Tax=Schizophyllum amplum TaxID=97359 RepID=A0A550CY91_9AGAR|nr:hypothetical protein BD626DRAFT_475209 [Auriculariopsis ampla]